jgi:hypothetical protein
MKVPKSRKAPKLEDNLLEEIAQAYLEKTSPEFFYNFLGISRQIDKPGIANASFSWSDRQGGFSVDGPILVRINEDIGKVLPDQADSTT